MTHDHPTPHVYNNHSPQTSAPQPQTMYTTHGWAPPPMNDNAVPINDNPAPRTATTTTNDNTDNNDPHTQMMSADRKSVV